MITPIKPNDVINKEFPQEVFEAFNTLILRHWNGRKSSFSQSEVIEEILINCKKHAKNKDINIQKFRREIFEKNYLDVEQLYRANGWKVVYNKPAYCETYDARFIFSLKNTKNT